MQTRLPFLEALLLGGLTVSILHIIPSDTVDYYVAPSDPPCCECPGQPCQTIEYYFDHSEKYFNRSKVNVTMKFLQGCHTLSNNLYHFKNLNRFEMIGMKPAPDVVVHVSAIVNFTNVTAMHIENLTIEGKPHSIFSVDNCYNGTSVRLLSEMSGFMLMTISATTFVGVTMYATNFCSDLHIKLTNSAILNGSTFSFQSRFKSQQKNITYNREWNMSDCIIRNSGLAFYYSYARITIINTKFVDMFGRGDPVAISCIKIEHSTLNILGNVLFYNTSNGPGSYPYLMPLTSNVTISGVVKFANNKQAPIVSFSSIITLCGNISFLNNSGTKGGAISLKPSTLNIANNTSVYFYNNSASVTGGAIYATVSQESDRDCFYQLLDYSIYNKYKIQFVNNSARDGGNHIYGEFMHSDSCIATPTNHGSNQLSVGISSHSAQQYFTYHPDLSSSLSPVSSCATSVCLCDKSGRPQCAARYKVHNINVHSGEMFPVSVFAVGADYGTTVGTVFAVFANQGRDIKFKSSNQHTQWIENNRDCLTLNYTIFSQRKQVIIYLSVSDESLIAIEHHFRRGMNRQLANNSLYLLYTPLQLNVTLLSCPSGFTLLGDPPGCECCPVLTDNNVNCLFANQSGYHSWNSSLWFSTDENATIALTQYCPFDYCIANQRILNIGRHPDGQCSMNRAGRLCGGCKDNYSLAIGSSHCIHCPNNNHLAFLILFAAAGFLLVLFIIAFNLTVTQGMINGLIFYANIVWTFQSILFPKHGNSNHFFTLLQVFIAWLNLDFGIQLCFVKGLNSFWKTWLQYVFPFYIWSIAGVIVCCSRYSTRITNLFGNRAVSLLATLFLLSYAKLLRTIIFSIGFTPLEIFTCSTNTSHTLTVWSMDGHYTYCQFPHILLFITAVAIFTFLWLPYTLLLLLMQWLRKISHLKLLRWIPRFSPVYDAYFAPLKDKHHYWFGVLLLIRGLLLVVFASTYSVHPNINYLLLLITSALLLSYANYNRVYKRKLVQLTENFFFISLIVIGGSEIIDPSTKHAVVYGSIFITLIAFCGVVIWSAVIQVFFKLKNMNIGNTMFGEIPAQKDDVDIAQLWDSMFDETEPLLKVNQTA